MEYTLWFKFKSWFETKK